MTGPSHEEAVANAQLLMKQKDNLEAQIRALEEVLASQNCDMTSQLTDAEGFPRGDVDVYTVRNTRVQILRLRNDHSAVMKSIENALANVFKAGSGGTPVTLALPFARVDSVAPGSPASEGGAQAGDEVTKFGVISKASHPTNTLGKLPEAVVENVRQSHYIEPDSRH
ncbi:putative 26S proteasome regulatory subunit [Thoreauomyces humboldtii]|nr:putative 26S proteasome regulatory subunit [Thoreauomyces humboldtii]